MGDRAHPVARAARHLFPAHVALHAEAFDERGGPAAVAVPPEIADSVPKRRAEFIAGRACARAALLGAGCASPGDIGIGAMRAPVWPAGFVGSISHASGLAIAVAARASDAASLGLDLAEIVTPDVASSIGRSVMGSDELARTATRHAYPALAFTVVFAAKEALFKYAAPIVGRYFDFLDAEVLAVEESALSLRLRIDLGHDFRAGRLFQIRFTRVDGFVVAAL